MLMWKNGEKMLRLALSAAVLLFSGCAKDFAPEGNEDKSWGEDVGHGMIELGKQLDDPYSVKNITKAIRNLYPTKAPREDVSPTDRYVRFLPENEDEMDRLVAMGLDLMDHPLDYQIIKDGDYYHDPLLSEECITWQYAVVPHDFTLPDGIRCEILDECYIPTEVTKSAGGMDWEAIEREAYRISGNAELLAPDTKASGSGPKGRICIKDEDFNGGKPFGVSGVKIVCNSFVKFSSAYTDRDGYYQMSRRFSSKVRYRLRFRNREGFSIGLNLLLVRASASALGKASGEGIDYTVTSSSDGNLFSRCAVNNAVYDYIQRCSEDDLGIGRPVEDLRIWIFRKLSAGSSPMLHHGAVLDQEIFAKYLGEYARLIKVFLPDMTLGLRNADSYAEIYRRCCHQLAHVSHYASVGNDWWNPYMKYLMLSLAESLGETAYGSGDGDGAGHCAVSEMWAYFLQEYLYHDRYGGASQSEGLTYWFRPQIFQYLSERGMKPRHFFSVLKPQVKDVSDLKDRLQQRYPSKSEMIEQIFSRYAD